MLILTLPTLVSAVSEQLAAKIISHPLVGAVRYNSGGDTPYPLNRILTTIKQLAENYQKFFYLDLKGRQLRVARWTPQSRGAVVLNRDFELQLPGWIYFRGAGWFEILNIAPERRTIFFQSRRRGREYYLGEGQSVYIVAKKLAVKGYLSQADYFYLEAALALGWRRFMLSFVEGKQDLEEFLVICQGFNVAPEELELVLKIESPEGVKWLKTIDQLPANWRLMAARDDLWLGFRERPLEFLTTLKTIISKDPQAIVASRFLEGFWRSGEPTVGDLADLVLLSQMGYRHFMWQDELTVDFGLVMRNWRQFALPLLEERR
jgi:pyruvate kinase